MNYEGIFLIQRLRVKIKFKTTKVAINFKMLSRHDDQNQKMINLLSFLTCTAKSQMVSGRRAKFHTAHISLCLNTCHWIV
jgi:hypothetical protein